MNVEKIRLLQVNWVLKDTEINGSDTENDEWGFKSAMTWCGGWQREPMWTGTISRKSRLRGPLFNEGWNPVLERLTNVPKVVGPVSGGAGI